MLAHFQGNKRIITVNTDKGLGPGGRLLFDYTKDVINNHLGDPRIYSRLNKQEATALALHIKYEITCWISKYNHSIPKNVKAFLRHHLKENVNPFGYFYLLYKIHKQSNIENTLTNMHRTHYTNNQTSKIHKQSSMQRR